MMTTPATPTPHPLPLYCTHNSANLPILPDYPALIEYCKLNPETWVGRFQSGMAVMNDDGAFALLGTEAVDELKERMARPVEGDGAEVADGDGDMASDDAEAGDGAERKGCDVEGCDFVQSV